MQKLLASFVLVVVVALAFPTSTQAECPFSDCCFNCSQDAEFYSVCDRDTYGSWYNCRNGWRDCWQMPGSDVIWCQPHCGDDHCYWI